MVKEVSASAPRGLHAPWMNQCVYQVLCVQCNGPGFIMSVYGWHSPLVSMVRVRITRAEFFSSLTPCASSFGLRRRTVVTRCILRFSL